MNNEIEKLSNKMPYTVPQGFFETMQARIEQAIDKVERRKQRLSIVKWSMATAATVAIAVLSLISLKPTTPLQPIHIAQDATEQNGIGAIGDEELDLIVAINNSDVFLTCDDEFEVYY